MSDTAAAPLSPDLCRWCAALFLRPPDAKALAAYRSVEGRRLLDALGADEAFAPAAAILREATRPGADLSKAARQFEGAHSSAFLTGGRKSAPPYASFWLSERGLLFQEPTRTMSRLLAETAVRPDDGVREPPDHIGLQLNLLAELSERSQDGRPIPVDPREFARDHILTWLPAFAASCARQANPFFYSALAKGLTEAIASASRWSGDEGDVPREAAPTGTTGPADPSSSTCLTRS